MTASSTIPGTASAARSPRPPGRRIQQGRCHDGHVRGRRRGRHGGHLHRRIPRRHPEPCRGRRTAPQAGHGRRAPPRDGPAAKILGIRQRWLGFVDSGLPEGDPLPPLPAGSFATLPLHHAAAPLVRLVRSLSRTSSSAMMRTAATPTRTTSWPTKWQWKPSRLPGMPAGTRKPGSPGSPESCTTTAPSARTLPRPAFRPRGGRPAVPVCRAPGSVAGGGRGGAHPAAPAHATTTQVDCGDSSKPAMTPSAPTARRWIRWGSSSPCRPTCSGAPGRGRTTR